MSEQREQKYFRIIDKGGVKCDGVQILDTNGIDIANRVRSYKIERRVGCLPVLILETTSFEYEGEGEMDVTSLAHKEYREFRKTA